MIVHIIIEIPASETRRLFDRGEKLTPTYTQTQTHIYTQTRKNCTNLQKMHIIIIIESVTSL